MQKLMQQLLFFFLAILCLLNSTSVLAKTFNNAFNIVPTSSTANLSPTGTATVTYIVTNDTKHPINQLTINPTHQTTGNAAGIRLQNNTCASVTLLPNQSCTFQLLSKGMGQPSSFLLKPRVCGVSGDYGALCSVPIAKNGVQVATLRQSYAYVTNYSSNTVSICPLNSNGTLGACTATNPGGTFNGPSNIVFNCAHTYAYVSNYNTNAISICPINSNGLLGTCTTSLDASFNGPSSLAISAVGGLAYVVNYNNNTVSVCPINSDGSLSACTASNPGGTLMSPDVVVLNTKSTFAYVTNTTDASISICPTNSLGTLGTCVRSPDSTFFGPAGFTFNAAGTIAYVVNGKYPYQTVSLCPINSDGTLATCTALNSSTFLGNNFGKIALDHESKFAYVANQYNNYVSICPINTNGTFDTCTSSLDATFNGPQGVALL